MNLEDVLDETYLSYFGEHPNIQDQWLFMQNLALRDVRRHMLDTLDIPADSHVLDLGCGFGLLAMDLAAKTNANVTAVDMDENKVEAAKAMLDALMERVKIQTGCVSFLTGDAYELDLDDTSFDWVISQHVFQHLSDPSKALAEVFRVLKPGGFVCIIDVDDGLSAMYPERASLKQLSSFLRQVQAQHGGDREVGRKLPTLMHEAGFEVTATRPIVQAAFVSEEDQALMRTVMAQHFSDVRDNAVALGLTTYEEFHALLQSFLHDAIPRTFGIDTRMMVIGRKPA